MAGGIALILGQRGYALLVQLMIEKSGQMLSPCVEIDGRMLADISGEEVEAYLLANRLVAANERTPEAPINQPCADETPRGAGIQFVQK